MDSFAWFITFRKTLNTSHFSLAHSQSPDSTLVHGGDLARYQVLNLETFNKKPFSNYRGEQAFCGPQPRSRLWTFLYHGPQIRNFLLYLNISSLSGN